MKHRRSIILLLLANFISGVSQGISMIAIPWYFTQIDGMGIFGVVFAMTNVAAMIWVPYSGVLTDRFERRKILMVVMSVLGFLILSIGAIGFYREGLPWGLVASVFVLTFLNYNIHYPTLYALVQEMTESEHYGRITSYIEIQGQTATIMAGAGAAFLLAGTQGGSLEIFGLQLTGLPEITPWQIHEIFLLDGITYFFGFLIITLIKYRPESAPAYEKGNILERLNTGVSYLRAHPYITIFGLASYAVFVAVLIDGFYLMAPYVSNHLEAGASVYAGGEIAYAMGAIFAGIFIRSLFKRSTLTDSVIVMSLATGSLLMVLYLTQSVLLFFIMSVILGLCNSGIRIQRVTYLFTRVPNEIYGRVNSVFNMSNILVRIILLSVFSMAFFQEGRNVIYAFLILSIFVFAGATVLIRFRKNILIDNKGS